MLKAHSQFIGSETQQDAARWRALTYNSLERGSSSPLATIVVEDNAASWAKEFVSHVMENTIKALVHMFRPEYELELSAKTLTSFNDLAVDAYLWNHQANTGFFHHDFHPHFFPSNELFNSREMVRESGIRTTTERTVRIVACVGMGLKSSAARGPDQDPEQVVQLKVPIVTARDI